MPELHRNPGPANQPAFDRVRAFVTEAADSGRNPSSDWRAALRDVAAALDEIVYGEFAHPDSVASAVTAMNALAGVWLPAGEVDQLYLGKEGAPGE